MLDIPLSIRTVILDYGKTNNTIKIVLNIYKQLLFRPSKTQNVSPQIRIERITA